MVLDFGGTQLFQTTNEELWKGVFEKRKEEIRNVDSSNQDYANLSLGTTVLTNSAITIEVQADQMVLLFLSATLDQDTDGEFAVLSMKRNGVNLADMESTGGALPSIDGDNEFWLHVGSNMIDDPGEGTWTYTPEVFMVGGATAELDNVRVMAVAIGVS